MKISKAEESSFIWCIFFSLIQEVVEILKDSKGKRDDDYFDDLKYIIIDDPVSSLDDNHLIELAVDIANLIKRNESDVKFLITTHNPLFYNVISNELNNNILNPKFVSKQESPDIEKWIYNVDKHSLRYIFNKHEDGRYDLNILGRKTPFSYHLQLLREIQTIKNTPNQLKKYHLNFLRNILEKTATFLGRTNWEDLLPKVSGEPDPHLNRLLNLSSHSAHAGEEIGELQDNDRSKLIELVNFLESNYKFSELIQQNEAV
ncbi:anticodon nuclease [Nonlabens ulvanivorans]|uniref:Anticodon nuclease n=1 Tax=Nonlabens ulvanivorans TaxID=906888 RepID=A0A090WII7_NONUL|nr:AAA family ATPase [Nonlabens ulvanivorans]GAL75978.1 anticodon nuclease [Nonlabens ulvanivorans]